MSAKVNFFIIGAAKCGTTSMYHYLKSHPEVYLSDIKESNFFSLLNDKNEYYEYGRIPPGPIGYINTKEKYDSLFKDAGNAKAIGDISPWYFFHPEVPKRIYEYNPDAKLIAIVRNPVDRAYSEFLHYIRDRKEPFGISEFRKAFQDGPRRETEGWHPHWNYMEKGFYAKHLLNYLKTFPKTQIKIYIFEDYRNNQKRLFREIAEFIGIDSNFEPETETHYNTSGIPRSQIIQDWIHRPNLIKSILRGLVSKDLRSRIKAYMEIRNLENAPALNKQDREVIYSVYKEDIAVLEKLMDRSLSIWKL